MWLKKVFADDEEGLKGNKMSTTRFEWKINGKSESY